ncbi:micrococcal nuclease-like nuclease [Halogeometricum pallidum JCM 14848]|uniref:Micrococcal nuclease-like nuclease n=1 Tax=Halogeometricum pallidum JCM 14848 TaxID=1227487 RepID=M0CUX1_HALPD|nr:lamin tail domain-containing protein [Halogeometricum pallidum]ELZ26433.1 micrococcal nuclease-like nuclease [Halogeometricum pallidum JCM 14848]
MRPRLLAFIAVVLVLGGCLGVGPSAPEPTGTVQTPKTPDATPSSTFEGATPAEPGVRVTVTEVVDGDTVKIRYANGSRDTVRLLGVDTPEVYGSNTPGEYEGVPDTGAGAACLDAAGENASAYAKARLSGERVRLVFDDTADRRGYYDRLLAYVYVDGDSFNYALVESGRARLYESTFTERERYRAAEADARSARRGLWSCVDPSTPDASPGSVTDAEIAVAEIHADAAGNDNENPNDEYVVFRNEGEEAVDLSGWSVVDAAGNDYTFPSGTRLEPGAELTLRTGTGDDGGGTVYWGRGSAVWNNGGDTIRLRDDDGAVVLERPY